MPNLTPEALTKVLETGDAKDCLKFFDSASEDERQALAPTASAFVKKIKKDYIVQTAANTYQVNDRMALAEIALLATSSLSDLKAAGWRVIPTPEYAIAVLKARKPAWLEQYVHWVADQRGQTWLIARQLVREGLCSAPPQDHYVMGMLHAASGWMQDPFIPKAKELGVAEYLRRDGQFLQQEVWRLFQIEGNGDMSLAAADKYIGRRADKMSWGYGLLELARTGELSRERLLDESLAALNRGFAQFRVAWFSQFHELLEPTPKERLARKAKYLELLASPIPPTVTFALDALEKIDADKPLEASALASFAPVLLAKHKGTAKRGVQWLAWLAERDSNCRSEAAKLGAQALAHDATDVQKAAIELLAKFGDAADKDLRALVAKYKPGVAASLKNKIDQWLGNSEKPAPAEKSRKGEKSSEKPCNKAAGDELKTMERLAKEAASLDKKWRQLAGIDSILQAWKNGQVELAPAQFAVFDVPQLYDENRIEPIASLDELIDVLSQFIEDRANVEQGERALDGLSRFADQRPDDFERRTGPLFKRVKKLTGKGGWKPFFEGGLDDDMLDIVLVWASGEMPTCSYKLQTRPARSHEVAQRLTKREARPLLSSPTHRGGWIDPLVIAERLTAWEKAKDTPPTYDAAFALLRLAPDNRAKALKSLAKFAGEFADAFRHALGAEDVKIGGNEVLWACAARSRDPYADDARVQKKHGDLGADGAVAARYAAHWTSKEFKDGGRTYTHHYFHLDISPKPDRKSHSTIPMVEFHGQTRAELGEAESNVTWLTYVWPAGREALFARGAAALANNLDWWEAAWENKKFLEPLLDANCPLGEMGLLLLALGICAKEPGEHGLATDILIVGLQDGRVDLQRLATKLVELMQDGGAKPARIAKVLGTVARNATLHLFAVRQLVEAILLQTLSAQGELPKDLPSLAELLLELLSESDESLANIALRDKLAAQTGSGKLPKAAKAILSLPERTNASHRAAAIAEALQHRITRVQAWSR